MGGRQWVKQTEPSDLAASLASTVSSICAALTCANHLPTAHTAARYNAVRCSTKRTCVYLSMNIRALGTLWSPRCTTLLPTQPPRRRWQRARIACIARPTALKKGGEEKRGLVGACLFFTSRAPLISGKRG